MNVSPLLVPAALKVVRFRQLVCLSQMLCLTGLGWMLWTNGAWAQATLPTLEQPVAPVVASPNSTSIPVVPKPVPDPGDIKPLEQPAVTLYDEKALSEGATLLNSVLTASVTKVESYPIDLPIILHLVEAQNLPLARDRLTSKVENNQYYRVLSDLLPDIQGTYVQSRFQGAIQVFGSQTIQVYQTRLVPQLAAVWTINPGGLDVFNALAAKQRAKGAKVQVVATLQSQLSDATNQYYDLLAAGVDVTNFKINIQEAEGQVKLNEARVKAGVGTKLDLERARSQLVQREQSLIQAENRLAQAQQVLLRTLNLDPDIELIPPQVLAQPRVLVPLTLNTEQLIAKALLSNPNLQVTQADIRALEFERKAALSKVVPSVTLQTYINGTGPAISQLGLSRFGGLAIQANLLDNLGTAIPLDYRTRRLQVQRRQTELKLQIRDIQTEVINAYLDSRAAAKGIFTAQEELAVAQEAYRLSFGRYRAGLGINVDLLNAQTVLATARSSIVNQILNFNQAQVRLLRALGEVSYEHITQGIKADAFLPSSSPSKP